MVSTTKKLRDLLTLGSSTLVANVIPGLFWLFLAALLTKENYGELGYLMSLAMVGHAMSVIGLHLVILVYEPKKQNVFPASFVLTLLASGISAVIIYVLTQNIFVSVLVLGLTVFNIILVGILSKQRYSDYSKHLLIKSSVSVGSALLFYYLIGINGILLGYFIGCLIILRELHLLIKNKKFEFSLLKPKIKFIVAAQATRISIVIFKHGDKLVIGTLFGFSLLGGYYFAAQFLALLTTVPRTLTHYLLPQESEGQKNIKIKYFSIMFSLAVSLVSIMVVPIGITTFLPEYEDSILPIQIMSIGLVPLTIAAIQNIQFLGKENSLLVLIGSIIQFSSYLILLVLLGDYYGLTGFAIAFLVSVIIKTIYNLYAGFQLKRQQNV